MCSVYPTRTGGGSSVCVCVWGGGGSQRLAVVQKESSKLNE